MSLFGFIILSLLSDTIQADWVRVLGTNPLPRRTEFYVATYFHQGLIDPQLLSSSFNFYVSLVYDFARLPVIVYAKTSPYQLGAQAAHDEASDWLIRIESQRVRGINRRLFMDATFTGDEDLDSP
jgi:hypothetical protein